MFIIGPFIGKLFSYFPWISWTEIEPLLKWEFLPLLHATAVIFFTVLLIYIFKTTRNTDANSSSLKATNPGQFETKIEHLVWINKILSWLSGSSPLTFPFALEKWIQDLNLQIASQAQQIDALIYGLREGSALPTVVEIKAVETIGKNIHARILLRTSEFGFMVAIGKKSEFNGKRGECNFTAIVTQFQCWFSLFLTRNDGSVAVILKPIEKRPVFNIKMKPHSDQYDKELRPEVAAQAIKEAVLSTTLRANLPTLNQQSSFEKNFSESEKSCYSDSENEEVPSKKIEEARGARKPRSSFPHRRQFGLARSLDLVGPNSLSAPGSPRNFNTAPKLSVGPSGLANSMGSLSSLTRSPSGRGPAKPIRLREKTLVINSIQFKPEKQGDFYPIVCIIGLDHPPQNKSTHIYPDSFRDKLQFDLSSRSSKLKIILQSCADSKENLQLKSIFSFDGVNMKENTKVEINMLEEDTEGILKLELHVISSPDQIKLTDGMGSKSESAPNMSNKAKATFSNSNTNLRNESGKPETKVTVKTVTKTPSCSPVRKTNESMNSTNQGISFNPSTVAETALKDLSMKSSAPAQKAKISITAVEKSPVHSSAKESHSKDSSPATSPDSETPVISVNRASSSGTSGDEDSSSPVNPTDSGSIRRTHSLVFGKPEKAKVKRMSMVGTDFANNLAGNLPGSGSGMKQKSSFRKLFSRKKKDLSSREYAIREQKTSQTIGGNDVTTSNSTPAKMKRRRSLKNLMMGKKTPKAIGLN